MQCAHINLLNLGKSALGLDFGPGLLSKAFRSLVRVRAGLVGPDLAADSPAELPLNASA